MQYASRLRVSLLGLLGVISLVAVATAAFTYASPWWASGLFSAALALLLLAVLMIAFRRGRPRAFWIGYVLFGSVYLALVFGPWLADNIAPHLLTTKLLEQIYGWMDTPDAPERKVSVASNVAYMDFYEDFGASGQDDAFVAGYDAEKQDARKQDIVEYNDVYPGVDYASFIEVSRPLPPRRWELMRRIGHSLLAICIALLGGAIGRALYDSQSPRQRGPAGPRRNPLADD